MAVPEHPQQNRTFDRNAAEKLAEKSRAPLETMPAGTFESSNVHSALYDFGERELYMRYLRDGPDAIYRYDDVPAVEWQGLVEAPSKGSYINANVAFDYFYVELSAGSIPDAGQSIDNGLLRRFILDP